MSDSSFSIKRQLDAIGDEFENQWSAEKRSDIPPFLKRVDEKHRGQLLKLLLDVDVELRSKAGQEFSAEDYFELGDQAVAHVRELLAVDPNVTVPHPSSMEPNSIKTASNTPSPSLAINQIGPYKLLQQIGEGGMGTVWMAEQEKPVRRRVALKVIKSGMDSKQVIARFEAERQAVAMMNHENIAKILDAGTTDTGQPYFVMELVQGIPFSKYCDKNKLSIKDRLKLFISVCNAVQHAHQKGIIHRDLKPSNVLVCLYDGNPVPKIIDFGLAKALEHQTKLTDKTMFTEFGQVVGTLKYMSPEQASFDLVDIDTRTDIYSLGIILYELLTGGTPLDEATKRGESFLKMLELIREKEPPKPSDNLNADKINISSITELRDTDSSSLNRILVGDLDWVVIKSLEKDRSRRYESVSELAADIQNFLNNEPVTARPPSAVYRIQKFVRKNRSGVAVAALLLIALVAGLAGTTWQMKRALDAEELAENRRIDSDKAKKVAQANEKLARQQSQLALTTLTSVISDIQTGLKNVAGSSEIRRQLLKTSLEKLEEVSTKFIAQASIDTHSFDSLNQMGDVILLFGRNESASQSTSEIGTDDNIISRTRLARSFYDRAFEIARELAASDPENEIHQTNLAVSHQRLGDICRQLGKTEESFEHFTKQLEISRELAKSNPDNVEVNAGLSAAHEFLGDLCLELNRSDDALDHYQQSEAISRELGESHPGNIKVQREHMVSINKLGDAYLRLGRNKDGLEQYEEAAQVARKLSDLDPTNVAAQRDYLMSHEKLGDVYYQLSQTDNALRHCEESTRIALRLAESDLKNKFLQRTLSLSQIKLARIYKRMGRRKEAYEEYGKAIENDRARIETDDSDAFAKADLAVSVGQLGQMLLEDRRFDEAEPHFYESIQTRLALVESNPANAWNQRTLSIAYQRLGHLFLNRNEPDKALEKYTEMMRIRRALLAADPNNDQAKNDVAGGLDNLGAAYMQLNRLDEALSQFEERIKIQRQRLLNAPGNVTIKQRIQHCLHRIGDVHLQLGHVSDALKKYDELFELAREVAKEDSANATAQREFAIACFKRGSAKLRLNDFDSAAKDFQVGVDVFKGMIKKGWSVENSRAGMELLESSLKSARLGKIALGKWDELMEQKPDNLPSLLEMRAIRFSTDKRFEEAAQAASKIRELEDVNNSHLYNAACVLCLSAASISSEQIGHELSEQETSKRQEWIDEALSALEQSIAAGWSDFGHLQRDPDLKILHDLPEFKALTSPPSREDGE